jgi:flagellar biosynthesis protein FlhF
MPQEAAVQIRTFRASSVERAWEFARRELGAGVELVTTRTTREGGFLGLGGRRLVEITVAAEDPVGEAMPKQVVPRSRLPRSSPIDLVVNTERSRPEAKRWNGEVPASEPTRAEAPAAEGGRDERSALLGAIARTEAARLATAAPLSEIEGTVAGVLARVEGETDRPGGGRVELPGRFLEIYATLLEQELDRSFVDRVVAEARQELAPACWHDLKLVREAVAASIERLLPAPGEPSPSRNPARTIALIGPTGVGKTTTLAKLAATLKLRLDLRVGLITCDTYRIAAVEQLRTYAEIIGLPLEVVQDPEGMRRAKERFAEVDAVLVDTAGRSQNDTERLEELQAFIDAAEPDEVHMVLSSVAGDRVLRREAEAFSRIRADRLLFTKLDEAVAFGPLLGLAVRMNRPVGYVTTGQEVPEHLELASPRRLAELVLGGAVRS